MKRVGYRYQRTIAGPAEVRGIGFLTGAMVRLRFLPAPPNSGILFQRLDLPAQTCIPARIDQVTGTQRRTTIGQPPAQVALVEHVLAALAGLRIDNCVVELNAPEPPGLDGSAQQFVDALRWIGTTLQPARRSVWSVAEPVSVEQTGATLTLHPTEDENELKVSYLLDYGMHSPIGKQSHSQLISPERFAYDVASCRTFVLEEEARAFRQQGLGARTTAADLLVFGKRGLINNRLRFANEPARHKVLDIVGDLALFGCDLRGHVVAYRSGHPLNIELVRILTRQLPQCRPVAAERLAA